jgi:hypothetical protein
MVGCFYYVEKTEGKIWAENRLITGLNGYQIFYSEPREDLFVEETCKGWRCSKVKQNFTLILDLQNRLLIKFFEFTF